MLFLVACNQKETASTEEGLDVFSVDSFTLAVKELSSHAFYETLCKPIFPSDPRIGSLIYAFCFIGMMWFLAWLLDKKKIYIKV